MEQLKISETSIFDYYKSLDDIEEKGIFREEVMKTCDISYPAFFNKMSNRRWTKLEKEAIEKLIEERRNAKGN